jgi:hypothetical protein
MTTDIINQGQISNIQGIIPPPGSTAGGWHSHSIGTTVKPVQKQDDDDFADFQEAPKLSWRLLTAQVNQQLALMEVEQLHC